MGLRNYRDLDTWQKAMELVEAVYKVTPLFPDTEKYGLSSQMQRAAVSIPSNVAEGYGRSHRGDYVHHLSIACGSLAELETQITLAVRLGFVTKESVLTCWNLAQETGRLLHGLRKSLGREPKPKPPNPKPKTLNPKP